jgi:hypothetical protein
LGVGPRTPGDVIVPVPPTPGEMLEPVDEPPIDDDRGVEPTLPIAEDPGVEPTLPIAEDPGAGDPTLPIEDDPAPGVPMMDVPAPGVGPNVPVVPEGAAVCAKHTGAAATNAAAIEDAMDFRLSMKVSLDWSAKTVDPGPKRQFAGAARRTVSAETLSRAQACAAVHSSRLPSRQRPGIGAASATAAPPFLRMRLPVMQASIASRSKRIASPPLP